MRRLFGTLGAIPCLFAQACQSQSPWMTLMMPEMHLRYRIRQEIHVMPDGSGKLVRAFHLTPAPDLKTAPESGDLALDEGIVAAGPVGVKEVAGRPWITRTFYFQDINRVKIGDNREQQQTFRFARAGDGYRLDWNGALYSVTENADEARMLMNKMFDELEVTQVVTLPATIVSCSNCQQFGEDQVRVTFTKGDLFESNPSRSRTITTGPTSLSPKEVEAFAQELEKAKAEWEASKTKREK